VRKGFAFRIGFPFQLVAEIVGLECHQHQAGRMREMPVQRPRELRGGGQVNEPVALVVRRAAIDARILGAFPRVDLKDLENLHC
jgi:hypothetical protein